MTSFAAIFAAGRGKSKSVLLAVNCFLLFRLSGLSGGDKSSLLEEGTQTPSHSWLRACLNTRSDQSCTTLFPRSRSLSRARLRASASLRRCSIASELSNFRVSPSPSSRSRSVRPSICRSFSSCSSSFFFNKSDALTSSMICPRCAIRNVRFVSSYSAWVMRFSSKASLQLRSPAMPITSVNSSAVVGPVGMLSDKQCFLAAWGPQEPEAPPASFLTIVHTTTSTLQGLFLVPPAGNVVLVNFSEDPKKTEP